MKTYISELLALIPSCLMAGYAFAVGIMAMNSGWLENDLRNQAELEGLNFEDYFLHWVQR